MGNRFCPISVSERNRVRTDRFRYSAREKVWRFTVPPLSPLLGHFGPEPTPATFASVAIDPFETLAGYSGHARTHTHPSAVLD